MPVQGSDGALSIRYRCSLVYDGLLNSPEHFHVCELGVLSPRWAPRQESFPTFTGEESVSVRLQAPPKLRGLNGGGQSSTQSPSSRITCKSHVRVRKLGKSGICFMKLSVGVSKSTPLE